MTSVENELDVGPDFRADRGRGEYAYEFST